MTPSVSIITVVYNGAATIRDCLESVRAQTYPCEHIVIDGGSTDGTLAAVREFSHVALVVSEPDEGIYDAMNKGIGLVTGEIIGILNADDFYASSDVLNNIASVFASPDVDACYGDLVYVDTEDIAKITRSWRSGPYNPKRFLDGWMPPHPTFFVRRTMYETYGAYDTRFPIAADYELMLRLLYKFKISTVYVPEVLVKMRTGGASNPGIATTSRAIIENYRAWKVNGLKTTLLTFFLKPASKLYQYLRLQ